MTHTQVRSLPTQVVPKKQQPSPEEDRPAKAENVMSCMTKEDLRGRSGVKELVGTGQLHLIAGPGPQGKRF